LKAFQARAKKTGVVPLPLQNRPKLRPHDEQYLKAFNRLSAARQYHQSGPQPLLIQEILAYCLLTEIPTDKRGRYTDVLQALDEVYMTHAAEKAEARAQANKAARR